VATVTEALHGRRPWWATSEDRFPRARPVGGDASYEQLVAQVVGLVAAPS
jgi:hypothetical protein